MTIFLYMVAGYAAIGLVVTGTAYTMTRRFEPIHIVAWPLTGIFIVGFWFIKNVVARLLGAS